MAHRFYRGEGATRAEIVKAAPRVCLEEVRGTGTANHVYASCIRDAVSKAAAQIRGS